MILSPKIRKALRLAAVQHDGQYRKDGVTPFIIHPIEVAMIVSEYTDNEDIISAALLHDVLEDTRGCSMGYENFPSL
ncbi:MAG: HD domain-containing protein [Candidatus Shapirobacteria bacterium]|jgi:(p)ppGpp synthase/HD superfamily hydrolase